MNTKKITREQVSALADGELDPVSSEAAWQDQAALQDDWELYHRIGDIIRSEELAAPLSAGFAASMAARLDAELPHAPAVANDRKEESAPAWSSGVLAAVRRYLVPGMAGTAALAAAILMAPQWMSEGPSATMPLTAEATSASAAAGMSTVALENAGVTPVVSDSQTLVAEDDIVRDPRIDQYLMAHQRFSPSAYSSSQFARSATFAPEADK